jgi:hypothetical protein
VRADLADHTLEVPGRIVHMNLESGAEERRRGEERRGEERRGE